VETTGDNKETKKEKKAKEMLSPLDKTITMYYI